MAYEAGPTGYALHRQVTAMGIACIVVAPSFIPVRPGDRIKTDRRDAAKLARLLRSGDLVAVWVPDEAGEALRDLVRARADAKEDQLRAKHRLSKLLLRRAVHPPVGVRAWGRAHEAWLDKVTFAQPADQVVFEAYRAVARAAAERVRRLEGALLRSAADGPQAQLIAALQAIRGIASISAVTIDAPRRGPRCRILSPPDPAGSQAPGRPDAGRLDDHEGGRHRRHQSPDRLEVVASSEGRRIQ